MTEYKPGSSLLTEAEGVRALQRAAGGLLQEAAAGEDLGQLLGHNHDVWAEVVTTKKGTSARLTLLDPPRYGFDGYATIEVRNVQDANPRFIATPCTSCEDTRVEQVDILTAAEQAHIADALAAIIFSTPRN